MRSLGKAKLALAAVLPWCAGCFGTAAMTGEAASTDDFAAPAGRCTAGDDADRLADQVLQLVNLERAEAGLTPVVRNTALSKMAGEYACRMIEGAFFGHKDAASGAGPLERAISSRYSFHAIGENLAAGQETAAEVMKVWMESPSHRDIILDPLWKDAGIAVRLGGEYAIYWVQEFGNPADF